MIANIIEQIKILEKEGFSREESLQITLINELKEIKEVLKRR